LNCKWLCDFPIKGRNIKPRSGFEAPAKTAEKAENHSKAKKVPSPLIHLLVNLKVTPKPVAKSRLQYVH